MNRKVCEQCGKVSKNMIDVLKDNNEYLFSICVKCYSEIIEIARFLKIDIQEIYKD